MKSQTLLFFDTRNEIEKSSHKIERRWYDFAKECGQMLVGSSIMTVGDSGCWIRNHDGLNREIKTDRCAVEFLDDVAHRAKIREEKYEAVVTSFCVGWWI